MIFLFQRPFRPGISRRSAIFLGLWRAIPPGECWSTTQKGGPGYSGGTVAYLYIYMYIYIYIYVYIYNLPSGK
jgi:hypothetical protein